MAKAATKVRGEIIEFMTPPGTAMYPWVFEPNPEKDDQGEIWHGVMLRFPKEDVDAGGQYADEWLEMRRAFMAAAKQGVSHSMFDMDYVKGPDFGNPIRDGDKFNKANNKKRKEELFGHYYINFKSKDAPEVVKAQGLQPITSKREFYPGCLAVVSGVCGPYDTKGNNGVYTRLTNVCKIDDGDRIGGKPSAKSQFEKYAKGAPKRNASDDADDIL